MVSHPLKMHASPERLSRIDGRRTTTDILWQRGGFVIATRPFELPKSNRQEIVIVLEKIPGLSTTRLHLP